MAWYNPWVKRLLAPLVAIPGLAAWIACGSHGLTASAPPDAGGDAIDAGVDAYRAASPDGGTNEGPLDGALPTPGPLKAIAAGSGFICVVPASGNVYCWGRNDMGQLGHASVDQNGVPIDTACGAAQVTCNPNPTRIAGLSDVVALAAGTWSACALEANGSVLCWGSNNGCALGHDTVADSRCGNFPCSPQPVPVPGLAPAVALGVGAENACAIVADAGVYCWGTPQVGMDGNLTPVSDPNCGDNGTGTPQLVTGTLAATSYFNMPLIFRAHDTASCVAAGGGAICWGDDVAGQLGTSGAGDVADAGCGGQPPCSPGGNAVVQEGGAPLANVEEVSVGYQFACARLSDGRVTCWGEDQQRTFATSDPRDVLTIGNTPPVAADRLAKAAGPVKLVRTAALHVGAVDGDGGLWLWGSTNGGAVAVDPANGPVAIEPNSVSLGGQPVIQLAMGVGVTFAQTADGTLWGWGYNDMGQLGHAPGSHGDSSCDGAYATPCTFEPIPIPWL